MFKLMSWLPLLCQASNGTDTPVLSISETAELERVLEQMIETLEQEDQEQEKTPELSPTLQLSVNSVASLIDQDYVIRIKHTP
ncbi:hypothetical protein RND71_041483 [Anisodus tanguticus]|uniref:Uncharacterized protein n=1 Tax=Anisodus tanguticus TaxID=243964 RepID=A0AAE1QVB7_9SOLA|nr:hypothetical protein RND71_041483 [Anisodus tanguticus]